MATNNNAAIVLGGAAAIPGREALINAGVVLR